MNIKEELYKYCKVYVEKREQTIQEIINSNKNALLSETKSSAGDKHETGRAMLQLEMEKASQQIAVVQNMKKVLHRIDVSKTHKVIALGSLVFTNKGIYYLAVSIGQVPIENTTYFVISSSSPIGKLLLGRQKKETITFNNSTIIIQDFH